MGEKIKAGCGVPKKPQAKVEVTKEETKQVMEKEDTPMVKIGSPAPDFTLQAYHKGEFKQFSLSEFKGKWVLLCFYPGDFTFV